MDTFYSVYISVLENEYLNIYCYFSHLYVIYTLLQNSQHFTNTIVSFYFSVLFFINILNSEI